MGKPALQPPVDRRIVRRGRRRLLDGSLRRLIKRSVGQRFLRICGLEVAASLVTSGPQPQFIDWLEGDHPICGDCPRQENCRAGWTARLIRRHDRLRGSIGRCLRGNWRTIVAAAANPRELLAFKLVCPRAVSKSQFEGNVELLTVLVENLALRLAGLNQRPLQAPTPWEAAPLETESAILADALPAAGAEPGRTHPLIASARKYIEDHLADQSLTVTHVAEALGVNPSYLAHLFSWRSGEHMSTYVNRLRIDRAAKLLVETQWQIKRVSYECGYRCANWFSEVFRHRTGLTPSQYRRSHTDYP